MIVYGPLTLAGTLRRLLRSYPVPHPETRALPVDPYPTAHASTTPATRRSHPAEAPRPQCITIDTGHGFERWCER